MALPNFFCIGAQKSGTSWLFEQLKRHPDVFIPEKELKFLHKDLDVRWYEEQYRDGANHKVRGDISPSYAVFDGVCERMAAVCPDARIVMLLRDPVERAYSQWKMAVRRGNIPAERPFFRAFEKDRQFLRRRGEYIETLEEFHRRFPYPDRLRVFFFDDVVARPAELLRSIQEFLEIDVEWRSPVLEQVYGQARDDRAIDERDAARLAEYYRPFNERLRAFLNEDLPDWLAPGC